MERSGVERLRKQPAQTEKLVNYDPADPFTWAGLPRNIDQIKRDLGGKQGIILAYAIKLNGADKETFGVGNRLLGLAMHLYELYEIGPSSAAKVNRWLSLRDPSKCNKMAEDSLRQYEEALKARNNGSNK